MSLKHRRISFEKSVEGQTLKRKDVFLFRKKEPNGVNSVFREFSGSVESLSVKQLELSLCQ